jgi:hypothetical protein
MRVADFGKSHPWPDGLFPHLDALRQGSVISGLALIFKSASHAPLWAGEREEISFARGTVAAINDMSMDKAIIVTQSCDLMKSNNPWVSLAPVYDASSRLDQQQQRFIGNGETELLMKLNADWCTPGFWIVDLRLEVPVEKSLLLGCESLPGFCDEAGYSLFAERLGDIRRRPALPNLVEDKFIKPFLSEIERMELVGEMPREGVREFRVSTDEVHGLFSVTLFVVSEKTPISDRVRDQVARAFNETRLMAESVNIEILGPEFMTLDEMTATEYVISKYIRPSSS